MPSETVHKCVVRCIWTGAHVQAFGYFDGVARQVISGNLKAGATRACFHEPAVNRTYTEMAHYTTSVLPARPYKLRDKAKVEVGVQVTQRCILGLVGQYGTERVDAACARALALGTRSFTSVAAILKHRRDQPADTAEAPSLVHQNIRGPGYYH